MTKERMLWIATWCFHKGYDFETLTYCDYMYGYSEFEDEVWEYVVEIKEIGSAEFYEKYKDFNLY